MFKINAKLFAACARFVSFEETRYYLNGVFVEPLEEGVRIVATDGCRMFAAIDPEGQAPRPAIVHLRKSDIAKTKPGRATHVEIDDAVTMIRFLICDDEDGRTLETVKYLGTSEVDGQFPAWTRVVPEVDTGQGAPLVSFRADVFKALIEAAEILGGKQGSFSMHAKAELDPALVAFDGDERAVAVVMPMRNASPELCAKRREVCEALTAEIAAKALVAE